MVCTSQTWRGNGPGEYIFSGPGAGQRDQLGGQQIIGFSELCFTGDMLKLDSDEFLYFVGHRKDIVRRRGENISAAEVEMEIETHPDALECAVIGVPSEITEEDIMVCVVLRQEVTLDAPGLADFCESRASRSAGATGRLKRLLNSQLQHQLAGALELEQQAAMACFADADTAQRVQTFAAKRL